MTIFNIFDYVVVIIFGPLYPAWLITGVVLFVKSANTIDVLKKKKLKKLAWVSIVCPIVIIFIAILLRIIAHVLAGLNQ